MTATIPPGTRSLRPTLRATADGGQATVAALDVSDSSAFASIPVAARALLLAISMCYDCDHEVEGSSPTRWKCLWFTRTKTENALSWKNCQPWFQMGRPCLAKAGSTTRESPKAPDEEMAAAYARGEIRPMKWWGRAFPIGRYEFPLESLQHVSSTDRHDCLSPDLCPAKRLGP